MAQKKGYNLVPKAVPSRRRSGFYQAIIEDFLSSGAKSAMVDATGKKPVTLVQGLRKAIEAEGVTTIGVVQRGSSTFLLLEE